MTVNGLLLTRAFEPLTIVNKVRNNLRSLFDIEIVSEKKT